jgi:MFS transporter, DHA1 family, tetracycline resistance protein
MSLWGLAGPPIQSIMTRCVPPDQQGRLQGAITSMGSFAGIFGPYLFAQIFAFSIDPERQVHVPGIAFLLAAGLVAVGAMVAARATRGVASAGPPP